MTDDDRDNSLDALLGLDRYIFFPSADYAVEIDAKRVPVSPERPHGLKYSLTLHNARGERLVGFDNAHALGASAGPGGKRTEYDHKHRFKTVRPYDYKDAATLLEDFWRQVDSVLREKGVIP